MGMGDEVESGGGGVEKSIKERHKRREDEKRGKKWKIEVE